MLIEDDDGKYVDIQKIKGFKKEENYHYYCYEKEIRYKSFFLGKDKVRIKTKEIQKKCYEIWIRFGEGYPYIMNYNNKEKRDEIFNKIIESKNM